SVRTALRTQQVIAYESGVADTVDPLAGSWYVEQLTDAVEQEALELIERVDEFGGVVACIENGFIAGQIEDAAYQYQKEIETGERIIVGVNAFQAEEKSDVPLLRVDPAVEDEQVRQLAQVKAGRDADEVVRCLAALDKAAQTEGADLMEPVLIAVRAYCSLGEICGVLRGVFGEYRGRAW
ncbi:MAG: methylmalonyl-CoA mutase, partial [Candidatus Electrothrix sp. AUS4]|nr:methylmalonyl-CoA mutase [Candidatus Electrothrix sp. AUS4]